MLRCVVVSVSLFDMCDVWCVCSASCEKNTHDALRTYIDDGPFTLDRCLHVYRIMDKGNFEDNLWNKIDHYAMERLLPEVKERLRRLEETMAMAMAHRDYQSASDIRHAFHDEPPSVTEDRGCDKAPSVMEDRGCETDEGDVPMSLAESDTDTEECSDEDD